MEPTFSFTGFPFLSLKYPGNLPVIRLTLAGEHTGFVV
jgi:hypothetical protein